MSRFDLNIAAELAKQSYRFRVDDSAQEREGAMRTSPLLDKEQRLLEVLQDAEETFDEWETLGPARRRQQDLTAKFPKDCERLLNYLKQVTDCWSEMCQYDGQYELARLTKDFDRVEDAHICIRSLDHSLETFLAGAQSGSQQEQFPNSRGPRRGKNARLLEFTKIVRLFWLEEISDVFGYDEGTVDQEDGRCEPTSAAARLIHGAALVLDQNYSLAIVREAMEAANRDPDPF